MMLVRPFTCFRRIINVKFPSSTRLLSEKRKPEKLQSWKRKSLQPTSRVQRNDKSGVAEAVDLSTAEEGLVIERQGDRLLVELTHSSNQVELIICIQRTSLEAASIVVGDRVYFHRLEDGSDEGVAVGYKERKNILARPLSSNPNAMQFKQIASNVDHMVIVVACIPIVPPITIDRYLVVSELMSMKATIVVNKCDLECAPTLFQQLQHYPALGYEVLPTSQNGEGLDELKQSLKGSTSIFVGQSGVGKSSLIKAVMPSVDIRVGELTTKLQVGSHTTSNARLYHLPFGGDLIDSPGIREFGLWHLDEESIHRGFKEIHQASKSCKFRNCRHTEGEIGCAVRKNAEAGLINMSRLRHYFDLVE